MYGNCRRIQNFVWCWLLTCMVTLGWNGLANGEEPAEGLSTLFADSTLADDVEIVGVAKVFEDADTTSETDLSIPPMPEMNSADDSAFSGGYTLSELEELALSHNPTLQQADAEVMRLRGIWLQVGLKPNPIFGYQAAEVGNDGYAGQQGLFVGQEFVMGDKLQLNRAVAEQAVQRATWQREIQRHRILNTVRRRYYEVLGAKRRIEISLKLEKFAKTATTISEKLKASGDGTDIEILQAKGELWNNSIRLQDARISRTAATRQLAAAIGMPSLVDFEVAGSIVADIPDLDFETVWNWLAENSPELQAAYYDVNRARCSIERAHAEPIPNIDAQLGIAHDFSTDFEIVNIQIGIPLPVFNRNQGNITAAQADLIRASREINRLEIDLRNRLSSAFQDYEAARNQVEGYQQHVLPLAEKALDLIRIRHEAGELDYLQLLNAQRTLSQQSLAEVSARKRLWLSVVQIQGLVVGDGFGAPGQASANIEAPDANTTYPLGLFPMLLP